MHVKSGVRVNFIIQLINLLVQFIYQEDKKVIVLLGEGSMGKSTVCRELKEQLAEEVVISAVYIDLLEADN